MSVGIVVGWCRVAEWDLAWLGCVAVMTYSPGCVRAKIDPIRYFSCAV